MHIYSDAHILGPKAIKCEENGSLIKRFQGLEMFGETF